MTPDDFPDDATEVWPENLTATNVFIAMSTQWRIGMSGPTGLDYAAIPAVLRLCSVPMAERNDVFECLRVMESEVLTVLSERAK